MLMAHGLEQLLPTLLNLQNGVCSKTEDAEVSERPHLDGGLIWLVELETDLFRIGTPGLVIRHVYRTPS